MNVNDFHIDEKMTEQYVKLSLDTMTSSAIPDLDKMIHHIYNMLLLIETSEMEQLEKTNNEEFERLVYTEYNTILPIKIISLIVSKNRYENLDRLLDMFEVLNNVKNGKNNIHDEYAKFSEKMNEEFVYSKTGGKEGFLKLLEKDKQTNQSNI